MTQETPSFRRRCALQIALQWSQPLHAVFPRCLFVRRRRSFLLRLVPPVPHAQVHTVGAVAEAAHPHEHSPSDVRGLTGHAESRACFYLRLLEAKAAGLISISIDPPLSNLPGAEDDPIAHLRFPFENAGALVATSGGDDGGVGDAWNGQRLMVSEALVRIAAAASALDAFTTLTDRRRYWGPTCSPNVLQ